MGNDTRRILIVDDDVDLLLQMKVQLEAAGFAVTTAESEKTAMEFLEKNSPDIAIVDLMMEHMDGGFVLCYNIKKKYPDVPVIMVTGVSRETGMEFDASTDEERSWLKADAILAKPIRFEQLQREIDRLLKG